MTGYGYDDYRDHSVHLVLELKSYNNRYLDIATSLPPTLSSLEPRVRAFLSQRIARGRVELYLRVTDLEESFDITIDRPAVDKYVQVLKELAKTAAIPAEITLGHLLSLEGIIKTERDPDVEAYWGLISPRLTAVFEDFEASRLREGETTRRDIESNLAVVDEGVATIDGHSAELEEQIKSNLKSRFLEMMGEGIDEARIMSETAVMLMKSAISEEVVRIRSHLHHFRDSMQPGVPVGKKLDFICQELGREINTIGSKSSILEVNQAVIDVKDALEKIREQLRNVE